MIFSPVAEWVGKGLQNLLRWFESIRGVSFVNGNQRSCIFIMSELVQKFEMGFAGKAKRKEDKMNFFFTYRLPGYPYASKCYQFF